MAIETTTQVNVYALATLLIAQLDAMEVNQTYKKGIIQNAKNLIKGIEHLDKAVFDELPKEAKHVYTIKYLQLEEAMNKPIIP